ncbi:hypothetical protein [Oceanobacillus profundus]|nr:hypothetical protein [Oceanobacillus profundus]
MAKEKYQHTTKIAKVAIKAITPATEFTAQTEFEFFGKCPKGFT